MAETVHTVTRPLPRVLVVHTGGTLGMDPGVSYSIDANGKPVLAAGTGGTYTGALRPGAAALHEMPSGHFHLSLSRCCLRTSSWGSS